MPSRGTPPPAPQGLEADSAPLVQGGLWAPKEILERLGPTKFPQDALPRLMTACAVLLGPGKIRELSQRLELGFPQLLPALRAIPRDETLSEHHQLVKKVLARVPEALAELRVVRANAINELNEQAGGLRGTDLAYLVLAFRTYILAYELGRRRNPRGMHQSIHLASTPPSLVYSEEWAERIFSTSVFDGFQLFAPPDYGRVLVVYDDGYLAYDPMPEGTGGRV